MKKAMILLLCALLALTPVLAVAEEILDGRWLCADVQGNVTADTVAELKDDFGLYVNKEWILGAQIPDGETATGSFEDATRTLKDRQIALLKNDTLTGHDAELVSKLYKLVTDWDYRNAQGVAPALPVMASIRAIDSLEALTEYLLTRSNTNRYYPLAIGVCGTGVIDAVELMVRMGVVDDTGFLLDADEVDGPITRYMGVENDGNVFYLTDDHAVYITQNDVRSLQLAKAAVCAGILTMVDAAGIEVSSIETLDIAGGFGAYLNLESAAAIGLFPAELLPCAKSVGNTSGEGATALVLSNTAREREAHIVDLCDYLELSLSSEFNDYYIQMMEFEQG